MQSLIKAIFLVILITAISGCMSWKFYKDDGNSSSDSSSSESQFQYGGQLMVRAQAVHGVNQ
jgi:hypothetical protein